MAGAALPSAVIKPLDSILAVRFPQLLGKILGGSPPVVFLDASSCGSNQRGDSLHLLVGPGGNLCKSSDAGCLKGFREGGPHTLDACEVVGGARSGGALEALPSPREPLAPLSVGDSVLRLGVRGW